MDLINIGIIITYIMVFGAALAVLGFSVMQMMKSPKNAKKTLYRYVLSRNKSKRNKKRTYHFFRKNDLLWYLTYL